MRQRSNSQRVAQVDSGQRCGNGAETNYNAVVAVTDLRVSYRSNNSVTFSGGLMHRTYGVGFGGKL